MNPQALTFAALLAASEEDPDGRTALRRYAWHASIVVVAAAGLVALWATGCRL